MVSQSSNNSRSDKRAKDYEHLYKTKRWQKVRRLHLATEPYCRYCKQIGIFKEANVVDHIKPHKGDTRLFWDKSNYQALCTHCHQAHKRRKECSGYLVGADRTGLPLDPDHPWN